METKDSGKRIEFETGAVRDVEENKPQFHIVPYSRYLHLQYEHGGPSPKIVEPIESRIYDLREYPEEAKRHDLIPEEALNRWAALMKRGADKYNDRNWELGIPMSRMYASALRHLLAWSAGDTTEDHLAAVLFNVGGIMHFERQWANNLYPKEFADAGPIHTKPVIVIY